MQRNSSVVNFVDRIAILSGVPKEKVRDVLMTTFKDIALLIKTGNTVKVPYLGIFGTRNGRVTWFLPIELRELHGKRNNPTKATNRRNLMNGEIIDVEIELGRDDI